MNFTKDPQSGLSWRSRAAAPATCGPAAEVPLKVANLSFAAAQLAAEIAEIGNINAVTDATAGVYLAQAAVETAVLNVKINATTVKNKKLVAEWQAETDKLTRETVFLVQKVKDIAAKRGGFA